MSCESLHLHAPPWLLGGSVLVAKLMSGHGECMTGLLLGWAGLGKRWTPTPAPSCFPSPAPSAVACIVTITPLLSLSLTTTIHTPEITPQHNYALYRCRLRLRRLDCPYIDRIEHRLATSTTLSLSNLARSAAAAFCLGSLTIPGPVTLATRLIPTCPRLFVRHSPLATSFTIHHTPSTP